jgi:small subunit ribosomal protein S8
MQITDPIADMLTRIRNASAAHHKTVDVPASNMKKAVAEILVAEGYIVKNEFIEDEIQGIIRLTLKYNNRTSVISGIKRISKPGLRVYANASDMPKVLGGLGIAVVSTNQGLMTDRDARKKNIGGEVLAFVW